ncbi:unnamed protein product [Cylicocyclus nassatus]|uniref:Uncharacterized protein n=1 Tax=Cylicocyclus nassatus TaxID=53992 RepID=A0AA36H0V5_CYLNA|nr:unnamed protein product [Cylicocyclus nassatus]
MKLLVLTVLLVATVNASPAPVKPQLGNSGQSQSLADEGAALVAELKELSEKDINAYMTVLRDLLYAYHPSEIEQPSTGGKGYELTREGLQLLLDLFKHGNQADHDYVNKQLAQFYLDSLEGKPHPDYFPQVAKPAGERGLQLNSRGPAHQKILPSQYAGPKNTAPTGDNILVSHGRIIAISCCDTYVITMGLV